jgi:hypothetical protein
MLEEQRNNVEAEYENILFWEVWNLPDGKYVLGAQLSTTL